MVVNNVPLFAVPVLCVDKSYLQQNTSRSAMLGIAVKLLKQCIKLIQLQSIVFFLQACFACNCLRHVAFLLQQ